MVWRRVGITHLDTLREQRKSLRSQLEHTLNQVGVIVEAPIDRVRLLRRTRLVHPTSESVLMRTQHHTRVISLSKFGGFRSPNRLSIDLFGQSIFWRNPSLEGQWDGPPFQRQQFFWLLMDHEPWRAWTIHVLPNLGR